MPNVFHDTCAYLLQNSFSPLPIAPGTKRPVLVGWQEASDAPLPEHVLTAYMARDSEYGVGIALGYKDVVALDFDSNDREIADAIRCVLPSSPVVKRGKKGGTGFYRTTSRRSRRFRAADGSMLFEILAHGTQTVLPPSVHPTFGRPYVWLTQRTLLNTSAIELPVLPVDIEARIERALAPWLPRPLLIPRQVAPVRHRDCYVAAVIQRRIDDLRSTGKGGRNFELNCAARRLAKLGLNFEETVAELMPVALEVGLGAREVQLTIRSGWRSGASVAAGRGRT